MTKQATQTVAASHTIDTAAFMASLPSALQSALKRSTVAFASVLPELLADVHGQSVGATVKQLDKGAVAVTNANGTRFKIVASDGYRFNVAPAFTKGYGRDNLGVNARAYLATNYDYVILVNVKNRDELKAGRIPVRDIEGNTIVLK